MSDPSPPDPERATTGGQWSDIRSRLARIAAAPGSTKIFGSKLHQWVLDPPLSAEDLANAETQFGVQLPDEYRSFLLQAGSGGAGPYYGLWSLCKRNRRWQWSDELGAPSTMTDVTRLREPFPYTEAYNGMDLIPKEPKEEDFDTTEAFEVAEESWQAQWEKAVASPDHYVGALYLCHRGCALREFLVVSGPASGQMWADNSADLAGLQPLLDGDGKPLTFAGWYRRWLDAAEKQST